MAMALSKKQSGGSSRNRTALKRSINFAEIGKKKTNYFAFAPAILIGLVLIAAVIKFGFIDRLNEVERQQQITQDLQMQLDSLNAQVESYAEVAADYAHFTYSGMTEEEKTRSDRVDILNLIEKEILNRNVTVKNWTINGNTVTVNIIARDRLQAQTVKQAIEQSPLVSGCSMPKLQATPQKNEDGTVTSITSATLKILFNPKVRIKSVLTEQPTDTEEATSNEG